MKNNMTIPQKLQTELSSKLAILSWELKAVIQTTLFGSLTTGVYAPLELLGTTTIF